MLINQHRASYLKVKLIKGSDLKDQLMDWH